ncbi:MAG: hypothetical protein G01um10142_416 [Parcubacteria group bacterium Gr01-1014_2]|nr:MAG: hypothetical protein G01um10142_416 [Parcubacteria group bacterium Gr01-1014_2]
MNIPKDKNYPADSVQCDECGFHYENREWVEKYEAWCWEHKGCNIEITAHAEKNTKISFLQT